MLNPINHELVEDISFKLPREITDGAPSGSLVIPRTLDYENPNLLFTALKQRGTRFSVDWKPWSSRIIKIYSDGILTYAHPEKPDSIPQQHMLSLLKVEVNLMNNENRTDGSTSEKGITVKCKTKAGEETQFRCIAKEPEIQRILDIIRVVAEDSNLDSMPTITLPLPSLDSIENRRSARGSQRLMEVFGRSSMRRAISQALSKYDKRTRAERTIAKRGVFKWMPVMGHNDLILGSWWFVAGSIGVVITGLIVVINRYHDFLGPDGSTLNFSEYVASWVLMTISGFFSFLGSLFFVRAFHEEPPLVPMFTSYHLQNDELVASWLFFLACAPSVPYCLILASAEGYNFIYLLMLLFAILICIGSLLFVRACYPSDQKHKDILLNLSPWVFCCCSPEWRYSHFMNDWLGGSWFFFWASEVSTFGSLVILLWAIAYGNANLVWQFGTTFVENITFLIGSAYFVAGSYPLPEEEGQGQGSSKKSLDSNDSSGRSQELMEA